MVKKSDDWIECGSCGNEFEVTIPGGKTAQYCVLCGSEIDYEDPDSYEDGFEEEY